MKKFQAMMAVVLVALMAFAVQSCGSDNDDDQRYTIEVSLKIDQPGNLTKEQCEQLIMAAKQKSAASDRANDQVAEEATRYAANEIASALEASQDIYGDAVMTFTLECKRVSNSQRVALYYVTYNKGEIKITNGKN